MKTLNQELKAAFISLVIELILFNEYRKHINLIEKKKDDNNIIKFSINQKLKKKKLNLVNV